MAAFRSRAHIRLIVGILMVAGGLLCAVFLPGRWRRGVNLARAPQRIKLEDLITKGTGDNPHVIVTEFVCGRGFVFETPKRDRSQSAPTDFIAGRAWVPLFIKPASDNLDPEPTSFVVLLETSHELGSTRVFQLLDRQQSLQALATPLSRWDLKGEVKSKLAESYPDTDFSNCFHLEQLNRHHIDGASEEASLLAIGAGVGLLGGLPLFAIGYVRFRRHRKLRPLGGKQEGPFERGHWSPELRRPRGDNR